MTAMSENMHANHTNKRDKRFICSFNVVSGICKNKLVDFMGYVNTPSIQLSKLFMAWQMFTQH